MLSLALDSLAFDGPPVLGPVSLRIGAGEALALMGPSGIGKSTLLRLAAGLPVAADVERLRLSRPARIGMAFQEPTLLPWRTAAENIRIPTGAEPAPHLAAVGLADKAALRPGALSLGQRRRLALARAFAADPELLLLDEPFASLDEATAAEMTALTARLIAARPAMAVLLVTHSPEEAATLATRTAILSGAPARIIAETTSRDPAAIRRLVRGEGGSARGGGG